MKDPNPPGSGKEIAEGKGVQLDLSKYFDTLNHEKLLKRYLTVNL